MSYRLSMLRGAFAERDIQALAGVFVFPKPIAARRWIHNIEIRGDYVALRIRGIERVLYWPAAHPLNELLEVLTECFNKRDWHFYEVSETIVEPGMTVLDCGAAEGMFALRVEARATSVYAFEPNPEYLKALATTFQTSSVVQPIPSALGDHDSTGSLSGERLWSHVVAGKGDVLITSIDAWSRGRQVDFIKADVEGMEHALLRGAEETILRWKPRIAVTSYHEGNDAMYMIRLLRHIFPGYKVRTKGTSYSAKVRRPVMLHAWV